MVLWLKCKAFVQMSGSLLVLKRLIRSLYFIVLRSQVSLTRCSEIHRVLVYWQCGHWASIRKLLRGLLMARFISPRKWRDLQLSEYPLMDWLSLLNFQVDKPKHKLVLRPLERCLFSWMARLDDWLIGHRVPMGGAFVVHAKKQVVQALKDFSDGAYDPSGAYSCVGTGCRRRDASALWK